MRRNGGDIVWKEAHAGFTAWAGWVQIQPEEEPAPCMLCDDRECVEWTDCWGLPGNTREQALAALKREETLGVLCHVSECQMHDDVQELEAVS